ncbi:hypothetical protein HXX76_000759 [Chlamydomonas incerta]|uniref:Uncharacterized protein n=1 Tax=Chlamydomonas incerta TaxID=51695 RepID=A0A835WF74_CHLIN|nr:hypothetical protein HXX76_000759 [Chlamydomonas incerta]|eukprot:KAG2446164.1 hypothetical protein HXX76_000759 [Chlamydomonas incerta]
MLLQPAGDYISAMQPLRLPAASQGQQLHSGTRAAGAAAAAGAALGGGCSSGPRGGGRGAAAGEELLLALADSCELQVWRVPMAVGPGAAVELQGGPQAGTQHGLESEPGPQPLVRAAAYPLPRHALIYSLAWIPGGAAAADAAATAAAACGDGAATVAADSGKWKGAAADAAGSSGHEVQPVILAAGTHQGAIEWYAYEGGAEGGGGSAAAARGAPTAVAAAAPAAGSSSSTRSESLRLLKTTTCGSTQPLVDLHFLPAPASASSSALPSSPAHPPHSRTTGGSSSGGAGTGAGGASLGATAGLWGGDGDGSSSRGMGGRGVLVGLQDASFALTGVIAARNTIQLFDVGTMTHLATVVDPFESHEFVCCCPVAGAARAGSGAPAFSAAAAGASYSASAPASASVDPHVLVVGSVHGSYCTACYQHGLPSLCHHKARSATAALSTLDVRCGRRGLTQRFGLHHRSLYPRLATAREHYIFTSHAGTPLEVYDRRAMSSPLFSLAHLPRPSLGEAHAAAAGPAAAATAPASLGTRPGAGAAARNGAAASTSRRGAGATARPTPSRAISGSAAPMRRQRLAAGRLRRDAAAHGEHEEGDTDGDEEEHEGEGEDALLHDQDQDGEGAAAAEESEPGTPLPPCWVPGYAAAPHEHQGLWLEASEDVLLGRADNGAVFGWDLSTVLGWAAGPDRSGLWHYLWEYGSGGGRGGGDDGGAAAAGPGVVRGYGDGGVEREGLGGQAGEDGEGNEQAGEEEEEEEEEDAAGRQRRLQRHGMPACLGWVECAGTMPVASLSAGNPLALFTLGAEPSGREYLVASVLAP